MVIYSMNAKCTLFLFYFLDVIIIICLIGNIYAQIIYQVNLFIMLLHLTYLKYFIRKCVDLAKT